MHHNLLTIIAAAVMALPAATAVAQAYHQTEATVAWDYSQGPDSPTSATCAPAEAFSTTAFALGDKLQLTGIRAMSAPGNMSLMKPTEVISNARNDDSYVRFSITPKRGVAFSPSTLSFCAAKVGTSGGTIDVVASSGDKSVTLATGFNPNRANEYSACEYDMAQLGAISERLDITIYVYNLNSTKEFALCQVSVAGTVDGEAEQVAQYTLDLSTANADAGSVSANPAGTLFDEGTPITVTATENFGYHFAAWVDAEGNTVSTDNPYSFEIGQNTSLSATYTQNNVYALRLNIEGGANDNLVQVSPEGHVIDGIRHYEEGTDVRLTALSNRILTFMGWEDQTTEPQRDIRMDGDQELTANFSACEYIVGWDFYNDNPATQRAADYREDSQNAGLLSLRNAEGNTSSWLSLGSGKGGQNGKYGARVWRLLSEKWYFEVSFSSVGYSNLVLSAAVGDDYNTYSVINAQYSTDGETFTTFGTFNPPYRGWDSKELALPAEAAGQQRVYIRFMPDYDSELVGVSSDYDGTSIAEVFVLADRDVVDDNVAPQLVATLPQNGATGASASGSIVLTFDERIVAGSGGDATLNGTPIAPTISGKNAIYAYQGLDYATQYTFTVPAGALTDRSGNAYEGTTITFTTMERQQPEPRTYDAVVAQDGTGDYATVQAAIDAAPEGRVKPWLIFVKNGEYVEHIDIPANKPFIHIIGQNRDETIISDDKLCGGDNALHVSVGATVVVKSNDCYFDNITLENSWGHDKQAGPQALALNTMGDRTVFNNVAMLSYQDTWITPSTSAYRVYAKDCFIEGAVDFIYNSGDVFIDNTTLYINRKSGGYIVAPSHQLDVAWGYVFMNCTITAPGVPSETDVWLGRPWHNSPKTVFINTRAEVTIPAAGWYETMGGLPVLWADYNTVDGDGNPVDLSNRRDTYYYTDDNGERVYGKAKNYLTDEEAAQYTVRNVLSGNDNWQPDLIAERCAVPAPVIIDNQITWPAVPYAICYIITKNGQVEGFTTSTQCPYEAGADYFIQSVSEYGAPSQAAAPTVGTGISSPADASAEASRVMSRHDLAGRAISPSAKGIAIERMANGKAVKVVR